MKTAQQIFEDVNEDVCLLHLVTKGVLKPDATQKDCLHYWWKIDESCENCEYSTDCLCCMFVESIEL